MLLFPSHGNFLMPELIYIMIISIPALNNSGSFHFILPLELFHWEDPAASVTMFKRCVSASLFPLFMLLRDGGISYI